MEQYIPKSVLVAEIERLLNESAPSHDLQCNWEDGYWCALYKIEEFIDTLEVKEVDLEKLVNDYFTGWYFDSELDILAKPNNYSATVEDVKDIAKYFFGLGMQVSNKAQKGE